MEAAKADGRDGKTIAAEGGFSPPSLSAWMNQGVVPSADQLAALSRVLRIPLDYFFEGEAAGTAYVLRDSPDEHLVDDLIAEAQEIRERAARLEMAARKLKPKPQRLTPEQRQKAEGVNKKLKRTEREIAAALAKSAIDAGDNREVKPEEKK